MKKTFFIFVLILSSSVLIFAQQEGVPSSSAISFTREELLACKDLKILLSKMDPSKEYSKYLVRSFELGIYNKEKGAYQMIAAAGGTWSEEQRKVIQAAEEGASFSVGAIKLIERGTRNPPTLLPAVNFSMKE